MKLAVVVQRYGAQINGGAELHARYIVELLAKQHQVEVLTTCARDYVTWRNEFPEGTETLRGVAIRRFPVARERDPEDFGRLSTHVFEQPHSIADELAWLESEGPTSPALIAHLRAHEADYQFVIFFSYRYYLAYHGSRAVSNKAILVPTAERDSALGLSIFGPVFRGVRALMYNSPEERAMIQTVSKNVNVPGVVVGVGSDVPRATQPERFRQKYHLYDPFVLYVGRIDENKGCRELFSYFTSYQPRLGQRLTLVLIGNSILPIPKHSNIRHLGYVSDQDKFDALAAAELLAMPSYYESLSMVALEAWALGKPVLANGKCDVLRGQCIRSRAGLYYDTFDEFAETLFTLTTFKPLNESLGENGRRFYEQHYAWPVIERKYLDMLNRLADEDRAGRQRTEIEPLPGWLARRRKTQPPAAEVVDALPKGAGTAAAAAAASATAAGVSASAGASGAGTGPAAGASDRDPAAARATGGSPDRADRRDRVARDRSDRDRPDRERGDRERGDRPDRPRRRGGRDSRHGRPRSADRAASGDRAASADRSTSPGSETSAAAHARGSSQSPAGEGTRDPREPREAREQREPREPREQRESREPREPRSQRDRDPRDRSQRRRPHRPGDRDRGSASTTQGSGAPPRRDPAATATGSDRSGADRSGNDRSGSDRADRPEGDRRPRRRRRGGRSGNRGPREPRGDS